MRLFQNAFLVALILGFQAAWSFSLLEPILTTENLRMGPNHLLRVSSISPVNMGGWLPSADAKLSFVWFEPLQESQFGDAILLESRYIRYDATVVVSPFYSAFSSNVGIKLLPRFEIGPQYQVMLYHATNVEQAGPESDESLELANTWRGDYLWNNMGRMEMEYAQYFGFLANVDLSWGDIRSALEYRFYLIDVRAKFVGKSMDYISMLPVDDRDFYMQVLFNWSFPLPLESWRVRLDAMYEQTGLRGSYFGVYDKEAVPQSFILLGGEQDLESKSQWSIQAGVLLRSHRYTQLCLGEHFLVRMAWNRRIGWF